jgi:hypothetical protein
MTSVFGALAVEDVVEVEVEDDAAWDEAALEVEKGDEVDEELVEEETCVEVLERDEEVGEEVVVEGTEVVLVVTDDCTR